VGTKGKPVGVYVPPEVDLSLHVLSLRLKKEAGIAINKSGIRAEKPIRARGMSIASKRISVRLEKK